MSLQGLKTFVDFVQIVWSDFTNTTRCRVLPWAYFEKLMQSSRPGVSVSKVVLLLVNVQHPEGHGAEGEWHLAIDIDTIRVCPYRERTAMVMGWFQEKWPQSPEKPLACVYDPRSILRRIVEYVTDVYGQFSLPLT
jgi:glutamine synthetase